MYSPTPDLTTTPANSPISDGVLWVQGVALGSTATTIAVLAVAVIGLLMLSGRLELRRGIAVVLGCFILFGASSIAAAITGLGKFGPQLGKPATLQAVDQPPPSRPPASSPIAYDPYAGASVPTRR